MNGVTIGPGPSSSNGYAKYQIRSSGLPRLAKESEVFSLEDNDDSERKGARREDVIREEKSRLVECPLDSDEEETTHEDMVLTDSADKGFHIRGHAVGSAPERSRLTAHDPFNDDHDSLEDELDLMPPFAGAPNANTSWFHKFHRLNCCNPRIPNKCTIM